MADNRNVLFGAGGNPIGFSVGGEFSVKTNNSIGDFSRAL